MRNNDKIHPVLLGVDQSFGHEFSETEKTKVLDELIPEKSPYILCVAQSYPHKNINLLIDAFNLILEDIPHNLVVVGKPRRGEEAVTQATRKISDPNGMLGSQRVYPTKVYRYSIRMADLFVFPSAYEGFGLPVIEAMMAGTPVITTREGALEEVGGTHAFYVSDVSPETIAEQIVAALQMDFDQRSSFVVNATRMGRIIHLEKICLRNDESIRKFDYKLMENKDLTGYKK